MQAYIIRRLITGVFILFILSLVVFLLLRIAPGDPANLRCGLDCPPERRAAIHAALGLDKPYFPISIDFTRASVVAFSGDSQYGSWMVDVVTGDLGVSTFNGQPVLDALKQRLPVTLELLIITMLVTVAAGIPFGIISALFRNSPPDFAVRIVAVLWLAVPSFWIATLVLFIPLELWGYAPPLGRTVDFFDNPWDNLRQFIPPAIVLGLASAAGVMRLTRSSLLEVMRTDYIRTAQSKGLRDTVVVGRHALKNSLIPVVTVIGLQVSALLGGTVIIEQIFALPGLGQYILQSLIVKDFPVVQTMTLYAGVAVVLMNLLVDISYAWLDPRIRYA
ncbi:MAG: ABC transporter permease [Chloroflexi bacterium]|nr:ABC transporter permease [Chloroflexota bacterium]